MLAFVTVFMLFFSFFSINLSSVHANINPTVKYTVHMQDYGWLSEKENGATGGITNETKHIEAVKINLKNSPYSGDIAYVVHVQDRGWTSWVRNGNIAGTTGQNKKIEAIEIRLTGEIAQYYNIEYRAYVNGSGWQSWVQNGSVAGTVSQNKGIQAIEVRLTEKTDAEKNNKDFSVIKSSDLHTQGNNLVLSSEPDITNFSVTTNADSSRVSKYTIPKNAPGTTNYLETITNRYFSFQEKYGAITLKIKDIKSTDTVTASYKHVGTYNGRDIDMKMKFSNMVYRHSPYYPDDKYAYISISESPYSGYLYGNLAYLYVDYTFTYSDTGETVSFGDNSYITVNSLNAYEGEGMGEYVKYLNSGGTAYVKDDTNVESKTYSNLPVSPVFVGLYEDFNDELGSSTFTRNSVQFRISGTTQKFFVGAGRSSAWNTISSGVMFKVTAPSPTKDVSDINGNDISNNDVYFNQDIVYDIGQTVNILGEDILEKYSSFKINDTLSPYVKFNKAELVDEKGSVIENAGTINYNESNHTVSFVASNDFLSNGIKYIGETYHLKIYTSVFKSTNIFSTSSDALYIDNKATAIVNDVEKESNNVRNKITPLLADIGIKKIQIYTDKSTKGLPINIFLDPKYVNGVTQQDLSGKTIRLEVVDKTLKRKVLSKTFDLSKINSFEINELIPPEYLKKNNASIYEATIYTDDPTMITISANAASIETEGYTSSEKNMNVKNGSTLSYKGVVMTEREIDKDIKRYYETLSFENSILDKQKTGYGFELKLDLQYTNDLNKQINIGIDAVVNSKLIDSYLEYESKDGYTTINLDSVKDLSGNIAKYNFQLPHVYVEKVTGYLFTDNQVKNNDKRIKKQLIDGKRKLYIPIWADLGEYDIYLKPKNPIGVNQITFNAEKTLNVYAYMYGQIGSDTIFEDEILIVPVDPQNPEVDGDWSDEDIEWLKE